VVWCVVCGVILAQAELEAEQLRPWLFGGGTAQEQLRAMGVSTSEAAGEVQYYVRTYQYCASSLMCNAWLLAPQASGWSDIKGSLLGDTACDANGQSWDCLAPRWLDLDSQQPSDESAKRDSGNPADCSPEDAASEFEQVCTAVCAHGCVCEHGCVGVALRSAEFRYMGCGHSQRVAGLCCAADGQG